MSLDMGPPLRAAIIDQQDPELQALAASIAGALDVYQGVPAVFAIDPIPEQDGLNKVIIVNPDVAITNADGLSSDRPIVQRDIVVYGRKGPPGSSNDDSPAVEKIGYQLRDLFHKQRFSVSPDGYSVIEIIVAGPIAAPTDDDGEIARLVSLTMSLRRIDS